MRKTLLLTLVVVAVLLAVEYQGSPRFGYGSVDMERVYSAPFNEVWEGLEKLVKKKGMYCQAKDRESGIMSVFTGQVYHYRRGCLASCSKRPSYENHTFNVLVDSRAHGLIRVRISGNSKTGNLERDFLDCLDETIGREIGGSNWID